MKKTKFAISATLMAELALLGCTQEKRSEVNSVSQEQYPAQSKEEAPQDSTLTITGVAVGGAHASIEIEDAKGEEHDFSYPELDPASADTWEEGDTMRVTYMPGKGDSVISLRQANPAKADGRRK